MPALRRERQRPEAELKQVEASFDSRAEIRASSLSMRSSNARSRLCKRGTRILAAGGKGKGGEKQSTAERQGKQ